MLSMTPVAPIANPPICNLAKPPSSATKESWIFLPQFYDIQFDINLIVSHNKSFTHIIPMLYTINYNYTSGVAYYSNCDNNRQDLNCIDSGTNNFGGLTTQQITSQITGSGLLVVPAIYAGSLNGGSDRGLINILTDSSTQKNFISSMVQEAHNNGYAGYNLDFEMGTSVDGSFASSFISFINNFKASLGSMLLTLDVITANIIGTDCGDGSGFLDFTQLPNSAIDRVMIEDYVSALGTSTSCDPVIVNTQTALSGCDYTLTGLLNIMCGNFNNLDMVVILLFSSDPSNPNDQNGGTGSDLIASEAIDLIEQYGFTKVGLYPQEYALDTVSIGNPIFISDNQPDWYSILQNFLTS